MMLLERPTPDDRAARSLNPLADARHVGVRSTLRFGAYRVRTHLHDEVTRETFSLLLAYQTSSG